MTRVEEVVGAASVPVGLACPPAFGAEPEYYGVLLGQNSGVSLRGFAQGGGGSEGYPENHPAGGLVHSPPLKSLRECADREWMSITSRDEKHTIQACAENCGIWTI